MSSTACTALSYHSHIASKTPQGIVARYFFMLLPEHMSMLTFFGDELCLTPEYEVQNAHETMIEVNHSNDSHHRREIVIQSIFNDSYHSLRSSRSMFWQHQTQQQVCVKREERHIQPVGVSNRSFIIVSTICSCPLPDIASTADSLSAFRVACATTCAFAAQGPGSDAKRFQPEPFRTR
jgi:hypothetical protein